MDLDRDGYQDVVSGSWPGELYLFRGQPDKTFAAAEQIKGSDGMMINVGSASAAFAADWDSDGDLDLLVGNINGEIHLIPNEGTASQYSFGTPQALKANDVVIKVPRGDAGPYVADWDGDGKLDLLVGAGDGSVQWFRNAGTAGQPQLVSGQTLVPASTMGFDVGKPGKEPKCGVRAKICVTDWNEDGRLDLLLGDLSTSQPEAQASSADMASEPELVKRLKELLKQYRELRNPPKDETPEAKKEREQKRQAVVEEMNTVRQQLADVQGRTPLRYKDHGYVWLFLRKAAEANE